jgi:hypothetical protein
MDLFITPGGLVKTLYGEAIELGELGIVSITRASFVEPAPSGGWLVDLSPVSGPVLGPFGLRSQGLETERQWLLANRFPQRF